MPPEYRLPIVGENWPAADGSGHSVKIKAVIKCINPSGNIGEDYKIEYSWYEKGKKEIMTHEKLFFDFWCRYCPPKEKLSSPNLFKIL